MEIYPLDLAAGLSLGLSILLLSLGIWSFIYKRKISSVLLMVSGSILSVPSLLWVIRSFGGPEWAGTSALVFWPVSIVLIIAAIMFGRSRK